MREALGALVRPLASHALSKGGASGLAFSAVVVGGLNFVGYSVTALTGTHKITDLVGTGAFVASSILCSWKSHGSFRNMPLRPLAINLAVGVWGVRLASYLFYRILKTGEDDRLKGFFKAEDEAWFDRSKSFFPVNLAGFWIIQSLWAWVVSMPVTMATFSRVHSPLGLGGGLAVASFAAGFAIETVADYQKYVFKSDPLNRGKFIDSGLWSLSRHPNYFGELVVWWSIFGLAAPLLKGPKQLALGVASPLFISGLILYVSGVPLLEQKMDARHGDDASYKKYKEETNLLIPRPRWQ